MIAARLFYVSGKVQGVGFRDHTRRHAQALNIKGHAMNLPDGRVEVLAVGEPQALDRLANWLTTGSPYGRVDQLEARGVTPPAVAGFSVGWLPVPTS